MFKGEIQQTSSDRQYMVINRSVFGQAPFSVSITVVAVTFILLFTAMAPEASDGLNVWQRLIYWTLQISISVLGILIASVLIRRIASVSLSDAWLILITGIVASIIISPAFVLIEQLFPDLDRVPDSALDVVAESSLAAAIAVQVLETIPPVVLAWFLVNLPILLKSTFINHPISDAVENGDSPNNDPPPASIATPPIEAASRASSLPTYVALSQNNLQQRLGDNDAKEHLEKSQFLSKLPDNIGTDIMYVSSELHYLNVTTTKGTSLILGSINRLAQLFEEDGFLIHRSYWANKSYVNRIVVSGKIAQCIMQDGNSLPISRSKRKLLKAYFGNNNPVNANKLIDLDSQRKDL
ncbi:MAG: LytTR family DNA-binding domain-containing protein [Pseudomonadota bacterium]